MLLIFLSEEDSEYKYLIMLGVAKIRLSKLN